MQALNGRAAGARAGGGSSQAAPHAAHTSTFFANLWDEVGGTPDAASAAARSASLPPRTADVHVGAAGSVQSAGSDALLTALEPASSSNANGNRDVEERLRRHLQLTRAMSRNAAQVPSPVPPPPQPPLRHDRAPLTSAAPASAGRWHRPRQSAESRHRVRGDGNASAHSHQRAHNGASGSAEAASPQRFGGIAPAQQRTNSELERELHRQKLRAQMEWCVRRWRTNTAKLLRQDEDDEAARDESEAHARPKAVSRMLGRVGEVATRALQYG